MSEKKSAAFRRGIIVFAALMVLTIIEYFIGIANLGLVPLMLTALIKAALIVTYFMHIARLWREESH